MANKQLPKNIHLLRGTYKKSRHGDKDAPEVKTTVKLPPPPKHLDATAKAEYKRVCTAMKGMEILAGTDMVILSQYAVLYSDFTKATSDNPFTSAQHTALRLCAVEMGLTPSSRGKFNLPVKPVSDVYADY